jgi:hypothetical protein
MTLGLQVVTGLRKALFDRRRARFRWVAVCPAAVAALFAAMALEDAGLVGALPYVAVALLSVLYVVRPMLILWAPPFVAFVVYTALVLVNPLFNPGNGPFTEWILLVALGFVPTVLL